MQVRRHRHIGRTRLDAGAACDGACVRHPRTRPQGCHRRDDARLRYDRPHLRQCPEYDACAGREHRRGVDQGGVRAAFQGYRPAGERQVGNIRERSGARAHADTYGYGQHARRHGRRHWRYERAGAGLGDL